MSKKTSKKEIALVEKRARSYFEKWSWIAERYGWEIDVKYREETRDMPRVRSVIGSLAAALFDFGALHATIEFDLEYNLDQCDADIEDTVVHELVHVMLAPIYSTAYTEQSLEYTVVSITRVLLAMDKKNAAPE